MAAEVERFLVNGGKGTYVDCTLGGGGYEEALLEKYPGIRFIGIDRDDEAVEKASRLKGRFGERLAVVRDNFSNIRGILGALQAGKVDGFLLDLGLSSKQINDGSRGFRFDSPVLDMRMDRRGTATAETLVNTLGEDELADLFFQYGEERKSRRIAAAVVRARKLAPIRSAAELSSIVAGSKGREGRVHPATKVFQALRIAVNAELDNLRAFLGEFHELLAPGGRIVALSYHSLEDRMVKQSFRKLAAENALQILTRKVVTPGEEELRENPRSRSAKLRAAERLG